MSNMVKIKHHHSSQEKPYYTFHLITHKFLTKEVGQLPSKPIATMSYVGNFTHRSVLYGKRIGLYRSIILRMSNKVQLLDKKKGLEFKDLFQSALNKFKSQRAVFRK